MTLAELFYAVFGGRPKSALASVELRFAGDLSQASVEALLAAISGLRRDAAVIMDTIADQDSIRHFVRADQATLNTITAQLAGISPSTRIEPAAGQTVQSWSQGIGISWPRHAALRADAPADAATGLLAALVPLAGNETILVRVRLRPGRPVQLPAAVEPGGAAPRLIDGLIGARAVDAHIVAAVRAKNTGPLVRASVLVAVECGHPGRAAHLLGRVVAVLRSRRGSHGELGQQRLNARGVSRALQRTRRTGQLFSPAELAGIIGWPIGAPTIPGLELGTSPLLMPHRRIPNKGRVVAVSTWPQAAGRALAQPLIGALSHTLIAAPTGAGKSALIQNLIVADMVAGRGCLAVDGKGDLCRALLERVPPGRINDVILLDPAGQGLVPGLRVFGHGTDPELAADLVLGVLRDIFRDSWGVRSDQWLRAGLVTLANDPAGTLGDLPYIFSDDAYRHRLVARTDDPLLQATWAGFEAMKPGERSNQLGAPLTKLTELLGRRVLRSVLSQPKPSLDLHEAIRRNRIVLVSLAPGQLGAPASRLLGALVVHQLFGAVQARASQPATSRKPFLAYIDEPKVLGDIPVPLDGMFELARGMGVGLTLATQSLTQLPTGVRNAALTNAATLVAFRQTADDADLLAHQLRGVTADALQHLGPFEIVARIGLGPGETSHTVTGRTLPPCPPTSDPTVVRRVSAERYGTDPAAVDRLLRDRHHNPNLGPASGAASPVGRRRRNP